MDFGSRLAKAIEERGVTRADVAREAKVTRAAVTAWINGKSQTIKAQYLLKIAAFLGVSPTWLQTGHGAMRLAAASPPPEATDDEPALLHDWRWLTQAERQIFLEQIHQRASAYQSAAEERQRRVLERKASHPAALSAEYVIDAAAGHKTDAIPDDVVADRLFNKSPAKTPK